MNRVIGFDHKLQLDWLDATVGLCQESLDPGVVVGHLRQKLNSEIGGTEARRKTTTVLLRIWVKVPSKGSYRRAIVLRGITAIAMLSRNEEALNILDEALTHKLWRVWLAACRAVREVGGLLREGLPPRLEQRLRHIAQREQARGIRVCAELALEEAGRGRT